MDDFQSTEGLRADQLRRELDERRAGSSEPDGDAAREHDRRADKARYLREKLEQRARAENALEED